MRSPTAIATILLALALLARGARAGDAPAPGESPPLVEAACFADVDSIAPGATFRIACELELAPHWHVYWKDPGESGAATVMQIEAPPGFEVGELQWPRPVVLDADGSRCNGYEGQVTLFATVIAPAQLSTDSPVSFEIALRWLVCQEVCVMGSSRQTVALLVDAVGDSPMAAAADGDASALAGRRARLDAMARRVPRAADAAGDCTIEDGGGRIVATGPALGHERAGLILIDRPGVRVMEPGLHVADGRWRLEARYVVDPGNLLGTAPRLAAVVTLGDSLEDPSFEISFPLEVPAGE